MFWMRSMLAMALLGSGGESLAQNAAPPPAPMLVTGIPLSAITASDEPNQAQSGMVGREEGRPRALLLERVADDVLAGDRGRAAFTRVAVREALPASAAADLAAQSTARKARHGVLFWTAVGAGAGAAIGLINQVSNPDCRHPESLCPIGIMTFGLTGAAFGAMLGLALQP